MKPGIHQMSMAEYQADPCSAPSLSSGIAHRLLSQSPLHAWFHHPKLNPNFKSEEEDKFDLGSTAHALLLEGEDSIVSIDAPDWRTKAAKEQRDLARAGGKIPILAHKLAECRIAADVARKAIASCADVKIDLAKGKAEHVLVWKERDTWCRARPDWMADDFSLLINYKTTAGLAEPNAWSRNQMGPMGFDLEAALYSRGVEVLTKKSPPLYLFIVQENYPPYACSFVSADPAMLDVAERKRDYAVSLWDHCLQTGKWLGYPQRIAYAMPQTWQIEEAEGLEWSDEMKRKLELAGQG